MLINYSNEGGLESKSDEELIELIPENEYAITVLVTRYTKLIWLKARTMTVIKADAEDIAQEGLLGLLNAISSYDKTRNVKFSTFAEVCINNKMKTVLIKKNYSEISVDDINNSEKELSTDNPENILMQKERLEEVYKKIISILSDKEWEILRLYLKNSSYAQIAEKLAITPKSVDNAMQRVRRKLKKMWRADRLFIN